MSKEETGKIEKRLEVDVRDIPLVMPNCEALDTDIQMERAAIETYLDQEKDAQDVMVKRLLHFTAMQEMEHLEMDEEMSSKSGCKTRRE